MELKSGEQGDGVKKVRLTDSFVAKAEPGLYRDEQFDKMLLRVSPKMKRSFSIDARIKGKRTSVKLGTFPSTKVAQARIDAINKISLIESGKDPRYDKGADSQIIEEPKETVADFLYEFIDERGPRLKAKTLTLYERHVNFVVRYMGDEPIESLDEDACSKMFHEYPSPIQANRMIATLRNAINWGRKKRKWMGHNPCESVEFNREVPRGVNATLDEVRALMQYIKEKESPLAYAFYLFLLRTGCRTGEAKLMMWTDIRGETWFKRGADMKNHQNQRLWLGSDMVELLKSIGNPEESKMVFGKFSERLPWERSREACGLPDLRMHDLRKVVGTALLSGGADLKAVSSLLGHSGVRVTEERYAKYASDSKGEVDAIAEFLQLPIK